MFSILDPTMYPIEHLPTEIFASSTPVTASNVSAYRLSDSRENDFVSKLCIFSQITFVLGITTEASSTTTINTKSCLAILFKCKLTISPICDST